MVIFSRLDTPKIFEFFVASESDFTNEIRSPYYSGPETMGNLPVFGKMALSGGTAGILCRGSPKNSFFGKFGLFSPNLTTTKDNMT